MRGRDIVLAIGGAATAIWIEGARPAQAHAVLSESTPREAQTISGPDLEVALRFNCRIDARRSRLLLITPDMHGTVLPLLEAEAADEMRAALRDLRPGAYRLHWQVLSVDGHITRGDVSFRVGR
ncbi:copper resistance protein CopC [Methylosinus sporium]|uniref:Copper resistance protein CopC n=1 Tax=Methylosinus sporium TaxID=428 RepID=A0A549T781_METSR|nr:MULTISPECIES: copper resistance CopC family protein [Methylosinus]MBU3889149.1 copper resistance protein CopC [Methylosinus sp. KRF6]TRL37734.1 copper resistance protein CopC [Methylosinus sporium]